MTTDQTYEELSREDLLRILRERDVEEQGALRLHYKGETPPWQIVRRVRPRCQKIEPKLSEGSEAEQASNLLVEGDNLQSMVSLYKYRGQVDLVLTDPPYNTGNDFRYNDKWDVDPNDTDMGCAVQRRRFLVGASPTRRTAPAGSNRGRHGGDEVSEAPG